MRCAGTEDIVGETLKQRKIRKILHKNRVILKISLIYVDILKCERECAIIANYNSITMRI